MTAVYYDTSYLIKLQCDENGSAEVRRHAAAVDVIFCSLHGRAEFVSACHRKIREGAATSEHLLALLAQIHADAAAGGLRWLPCGEAVVARVERVFSAAPASAYLRAADAIHIASAAENGFAEIHSNDRHLLEAAPLFGIKGVNVIP